MLHKSRVTIAAFGSVVALFCLAAQAQESVPGEYIVLLRKHAVSVAEIRGMAAEEKKVALSGLAQEILPKRGATIMATLPLINAVGIKVPVAEVAPAGEPRAELLATLNENVELIEPNFLYFKDDSAPDPLMSQMWFLDKIQAKQAWDIRNESPNIVVAVVDTGVFMDHEDLRGNIWTNPSEKNGTPNKDDDNNGFIDDVHGFDFFNNDPDPSPEFVQAESEFEAHGTHVSGTIGALGNNGKGIVGITRRVQIMPLKFLGGPVGSGSTIDAISAIDYAVRNGARIINASWGGGGQSVALQRAIERANSAGVLFVAAAGNGDPDGIGDDNDVTPHFPSSYPVENVVAVSATKQTDELTVFSNFGLVSVDLAAPGAAILSTVPGGTNPQQPTSGYASFNGTSMATPVVSGSAALLMAEFPQLTHLEIRKLLLNTADPVSSLSGKIATGGRLNLLRALRPSAAPAAVATAAENVPPTREEAARNAKTFSRPTFRSDKVDK
jgi:subtilisin family serine protease